MFSINQWGERSPLASLHKKSAVACSVTPGSDTVFSRGSKNTEPGADRGPRAGSPRGVVVATGVKFGMRKCDDQKVLDLLDEQFV